MKKNLLKYLICPSCKSSLNLKEEYNDPEIITGELCCSTCQKTYIIYNSIPIFTNHDSNQSKKVKLTAKNFGYTWQKFSKIDKEHQYKQFFDWISPINEESLKEKIVLDAGCGKGHHLLMISPYVKEAIGVDLSDSVFTAYNNTKHLPNIHIIKADLNHLPLKDETFDYIYSIGVVHHTESPITTTKNIFKKAKNGSLISLWVYGKEGNSWIIYFIDPIRKFISNNFSPKFIDLISFFLGLFLYMLLKLIYLPINKYKILSPFKKLLFYNTYLSYICKYDFNEIYGIVIDHLAAPISHYMSKDDVEELTNFTKSKIEWHNKNSWRIQINK